MAQQQGLPLFEDLFHPIYRPTISKEEVHRLQEIEKKYIRLEVALHCLLDPDMLNKIKEAAKIN